MTRSAVVRAVALLLAVCVVGACSAGTSPAPDASTQPTPTGVWDTVVASLSTPEQSQHIENIKGEIAATCMAELGFDQTPVPPSWYTNGDAFDQIEDGLVPGTREFAARWGSGVAFLHSRPRLPTPPDPNAAMIAAMTESEKETYRDALYGEAGDGTGGCQAEAEAAVQEDAARYGAPFLDPRYTELEATRPAYDDILEDPRLVAAHEAWGVCMRTAGHPFASRDAMWQATSEIFNALGEDPATPRLPEFDGKKPLDPTSPQFLTALEIDVAISLADYDCAEEARLEPALVTVQRELDTAWYAAHAAEVEAFAADYADLLKPPTK